MDKDSEENQYEDDFDDFGFDEDGDELASSSQSEDAVSPGLSDAGSESTPEGFSSDLLAEMEASEKKASPLDQALEWVQANKLIAGAGGAVAVVILALTMSGGGGQQTAPQPVQQPQAKQAATKLDDSSVSSFFAENKSDSLADLAYKPKEEYTKKEETTASGDREGSKQQAAARPANVRYIETKISDIESRLQGIESSLSAIQSLNTAIGKLSAKVDTRDKNVEGNTEAVKKMETAVNTIDSSVRDLKKNIYREALLQFSNQEKDGDSLGQPDYIVQASIPGRAWLRNQDGILITVREGQEIPGFGNVKKIDPQAGTVTMSTDEVFEEEQ